VTVAAPENISAVWKLVGEVDDVISLPVGSIFSTVSLLRRQTPFDVAVLFPNSLRAALEAWLSGIPRRVGYRGHYRAWLLNQVVRKRTNVGRIEHQSEHYLRIARDLGAEVTGDELNKVTPPPNFDHTTRRLGLCAGAEYGPAKRWLPERFAAAAAAVAKEHDVQWILFGTAADTASAEIISTVLGHGALNRVGQTTLPQLIEELQMCRLLLTNDTGTMHLASLLGVPTVSVFGSTEPRMTGPLGAGHIVLRHHVECSPCFLRECPIDFRCMKAVTAEEAAAAVISFLDAGNGGLKPPEKKSALQGAPP
jgi:lipopolysaccharide heptosyltransferase II